MKNGIKKIEQPTSCKNGKHLFIVTSWNTGGNKQKALVMRCQHCLMPMHMEEYESAEWKEEEGMS